MSITVQETPNPDARRFVLDVPLQDHPRGTSYRRGDDPEHPLAAALLQLFGVEAVMLLPGSVTVNKVTETSWERLEPAVRDAIERWSDAPRD